MVETPGEQVSNNEQSQGPAQDIEQVLQRQQLSNELLDKVNTYLEADAGLATFPRLPSLHVGVKVLSFFEQLRQRNGAWLDPTHTLKQLSQFSSTDSRALLSAIHACHIIDTNEHSPQSTHDASPPPQEAIGLVAISHELADGTGSVYGYTANELPEIATFFLTRQARSRISTIENLSLEEKKQLIYYFAQLGVIPLQFLRSLPSENRLIQSANQLNICKIENIITSQLHILNLLNQTKDLQPLSKEKKDLIHKLQKQISEIVNAENYLYLLLHGQTLSDIQGKVGNQEEQILPGAKQKIKALLNKIKFKNLEITEVVSSELLRAQQTLDIIKEEMREFTAYVTKSHLNNTEKSVHYLLFKAQNNHYSGIDYRGQNQVIKPTNKFINYPFGKTSLWITHGTISQMIVAYLTKQECLQKLRKNTLSRFVFQGGELVDMQLNTTEPFDDVE